MLPLAKSNLFHYDLRLDESETANILVKSSRTRRRDGFRNLHLCPVDFESVSITPPITVDKRYALFSKFAVVANAYNTVWWQVLLAGYAWTNKGLQAMDGDTMTFFNEIIGTNPIPQGVLSERDVLNLLDEISSMIARRCARNAIEAPGTGPFQRMADKFLY